MRVWVSGAAGFVGQRLGARLVADGHEVIGVDRDVEITDPSAVASSLAAARPDALVHLAAQSSPAQALREPEATARINFFGARAVLDSAAHVAPRARILLIASGEVYGSTPQPTAPFSERDSLRPRSPYARSKACAELLGRRYAARGLDVLCARPFNHTGAGQQDHFVVPSFAQQVAAIARGEREAQLRVGNLDSVRDFLDVDDVVEAYCSLLYAARPPDVVNIASGVGRRIGAILDALIERAGIRCEIEVDPERYRPTDHAVGDASRLREATGWQARIAWSDTLARVYDAALAG